MAEETITQKKCSKCGEWKPRARFRTARAKADGLYPSCNDCYSAWQRERRKVKPCVRDEAARERARAEYQAHKEARLAYRKAWAERNREKRRASSMAYVERNRERARAYNREYSRAYKKRNPVSARVSGSLRRAAKISATPSWADREKIREVYHAAARLEVETGIVHHVDHIVPLRGKNVCGLHVHWNLQILTATENLTKGNKLGVGV